MPAQRFGYNCCLLRSGYSFEADKDDTCVNAPQSNNQFPEVFVGCEQESFLLIGSQKNLVVGDAGIDLRNVNNLVTVRAKTVDDLNVNSFVGEQFHAAFTGIG